MLPRTKLGMSRAGLGLTAKAVAHVAGLSEWQYRNIEYGRRKISDRERDILERLFPGALDRGPQ